MTFHDHRDDSATEVEVSIDDDIEDDCGSIYDTIYQGFLKWKPEYESMVEVEILQMPGEPFNNSFGPDEDDWDETDWDD